MRWLIAGVVALALFGGVARAQSLTAGACSHAETEWKTVSGGTDVKKMAAAVDDIPQFCPLRKPAERHLAEVRKRLSTPKPPSASEDVADSDQTSDRTLAEPPDAQVFTAPPPDAAAAANADPCSAEAIDAQDSTLPAGGPDLSLPPKSRAANAARYLARAHAFKAIAMRCGADLSAPLQNDTYAVELDPKNPVVLSARAEANIDVGDFQAAIADFSSAIAARGDVDPDQDMLLLYAEQAFAYSKLGMYGEEISDLQKVVDKMRFLNADVRGALLDPTVYKLRLARALAETGDLDQAEAEYIYVDPAALEWRDRSEIGSIEVQKREWEKAINDLTAALTKFAAQPDGDRPTADRARIEVLLGQAYAARGGMGDPRAAWDAFTAALADAPDDAGAQAGRATLTPPPAPPTFDDEPTLASPALPDGVSDLDHIDQARPSPFCGARDRNTYLADQVSPLADTLNRNIATLGLYSDKQLARWHQYDQNSMLTHPEKLSDEQLIADERTSLATRISRITKQHNAVLDFYNRVAADATLVVSCKTTPGA